MGRGAASFQEPERGSGKGGEGRAGKGWARAADREPLRRSDGFPRVGIFLVYAQHYQWELPLQKGKFILYF